MWLSVHLEQFLKLSVLSVVRAGSLTDEFFVQWLTLVTSIVSTSGKAATLLYNRMLMTYAASSCQQLFCKAKAFSIGLDGSRFVCLKWLLLTALQSALAFMRRFKDGTIKDLQNILPRWIPWVPPKQDQALQQGGMFVFEGERCVWCQYDQATGAHADLEVVLGEVGRLLAAGGQGTGPDCGCEAPTTA